MMNKKAQGLSLTIIIVAVIALIVLVVLVAVFTGRLGKFSIGVKDCAAKGGKCLEAGRNSCNEYNTADKKWAPLRGTNCPTTTNEKDICCIPI